MIDLYPSIYTWRSRRGRTLGRVAAAVVLGIFLAACDNTEQDYAPTIDPADGTEAETVLFGIHPLHNPRKLNRVFGPLVDYLNANLKGSRFRLEASIDYPDFEQKLYAGKFEFALPNPLQTLKALDHGYRVFGKMADDEKFRGIFLVRRDSPVRALDDLRGKTISYPAKTALAGAMMPQAFLQANGIDVSSETTSNYVGSQESSIMNVAVGASIAGATWPPVWEQFKREQPELADQLEIRWQTEPLLNNALVVRDDVPAELANRVATLIFALQGSGEGRDILTGMELSKFEPASSTTYEPVRRFLEKFNATVRPIE